MSLEHAMVPPIASSPLSMGVLELEAGAVHRFEDADRDSLLYVVDGTGTLEVRGKPHELAAEAAALVLAGESAMLRVGDELRAVLAVVGPSADRHAPLGEREVVVRPGDGGEKATGARSYRLLFGPHNGSLRATLFAGFIPPGRAPWHYHLYDEIVWVPQGPGRLHLGNTQSELGPRSAFRLRPREVHIVENAGDGDMTVIGVFTPAGSPSAAYLAPGVETEPAAAD